MHPVRSEDMEVYAVCLANCPMERGRLCTRLHAAGRQGGPGTPLRLKHFADAVSQCCLHSIYNVCQPTQMRLQKQDRHITQLGVEGLSGPPQLRAQAVGCRAGDMCYRYLLKREGREVPEPFRSVRPCCSPCCL